MNINQVLFYFRTHNNLYMPEMVAKLGETFAKALDMLEVEKNAILGKELLFRNVWAGSSKVYEVVVHFHERWKRRGAGAPASSQYLQLSSALNLLEGRS